MKFFTRCGIFLIFTSILTTNQTMPQTKTLKILAWNIYLMPTWFFSHWQTERAPHIAHAINANYDVLILSEAFDNKLRSRIVKELYEKGYIYQTPVLAAHGSHFKINGGVIILSKWPITHIQEQLYGSAATGSDRLANKGVLYVRILKNGHPYNIIGTHNQAWPTDKAMQVRKQQFAILRKFIDTLAIPKNEPLIIGGDLNVDMRNHPQEYAAMLRKLRATHPQIQGHAYTREPKTNPLCTDNVQEFLDYVLYCHEHLEPTKAHNEIHPLKAKIAWHDKHKHGHLSDHYAVAAHFEFPTKHTEQVLTRRG